MDNLCHFPLQLASFIADMGGTLGLWIGLSVLSLFEMVEFAMDHAVLASMKLCGWSSDKPKSMNIFEDAGTTRVLTLRKKYNSLYLLHVSHTVGMMHNVLRQAV